MASNQQIAKQTARINKRMESLFFMPVLAALKTKQAATIAALKEGGYQAASAYLHKDIGNAALSIAVKKIYGRVGVYHANRTFERLKGEPKVKTKAISTKRFGFNATWTKEVNDYLAKFLLEKITFTVNVTTRDKLLRVLQAGLESGDSVDTMVEKLADLTKENRWFRFQTARIVRTEVKRAAEVGSKVASDTFEYEQNKEWVSILDNRTRGRQPQDHANHVGLNGQVVDAEGYFVDPRDNAQLAFPGDPKAGPGDTINCRCTVAYVAKRDATGRLIPKKRTTRVSVILPGEFNRTRQIVTV